jgi:hypothetical protein
VALTGDREHGEVPRKNDRRDDETGPHIRCRSVCEGGINDYVFAEHLQRALGLRRERTQPSDHVVGFGDILRAGQ